MKKIQTLIEQAITRLTEIQGGDEEFARRAIEMLQGLHVLFLQGMQHHPGDPRRLDPADLELIERDFQTIRRIMSSRSYKIRECTLSMLCAFSLTEQLEKLIEDPIQLPLPLDALPDNVVDLCNRANGGVAPTPGGPPGRAQTVRPEDNDPDPRNDSAYDDGPLVVDGPLPPRRARAEDDGVDYEALQS